MRGRLDFGYDGMYSRYTRKGKPGESQGRKVTGLTEGSDGRRTAEGSSYAMLCASFTVCTPGVPLRSMRGVRYERGCRGGSCEGSVSALSGKSEWVRQETHCNLLAPQPPAQVDFGGRKNQPSPDLCRKPHNARQIACVSLHGQDVISTDDCREEGDHDA